MSDWRTSEIRHLAFTCQGDGCTRHMSFMTAVGPPVSEQVDAAIDSYGWHRQGAGAVCPSCWEGK